MLYLLEKLTMESPGCPQHRLADNTPLSLRTAASRAVGGNSKNKR